MEEAMRTLIKALTIVTAAILLSVVTFTPASAHHDDAKGNGVVYEGAGGR